MKTHKNMGIAFFLNLAFALLEATGGILTGSTAIIADAVHDIGDATSIGIACLLECKSCKPPDESYTFGYARYSVIGGFITTIILILGSVGMISHAIYKMLNPSPINVNGMLTLAVLGVCINLLAMFFTRKGISLNQKAVNLHLWEDVLGWIGVLVGAIMIRVSGFVRIDPLISVGIGLFILLHAMQNLGEQVAVFLEKTPKGIDIAKIKEQLESIDGVAEIHHIHVWSIDGQHHCATMHVVTDSFEQQLKERIRQRLAEQSIEHVTLETETIPQTCFQKHCHISTGGSIEHHHVHTRCSKNKQKKAAQTFLRRIGK